MTTILSCLAIVNAIAFAMYGHDKRCAVKGRWRVPESRLLLCAFAGGSLGALLAMLAFRHKTRKRKFLACVPLFLLLHVALAVFLAHLACGVP